MRENYELICHYMHQRSLRCNVDLDGMYIGKGEELFIIIEGISEMPNIWFNYMNHHSYYYTQSFLHQFIDNKIPRWMLPGIDPEKQLRKKVRRAIGYISVLESGHIVFNLELYGKKRWRDTKYMCSKSTVDSIQSITFSPRHEPIKNGCNIYIYKVLDK